MPAKNLLRVSDKGTYSHIYNKGIENRLIFVDDKDYEVFLSFLKEYLSSPELQMAFKKDFTVNGKTYRGTPHRPKNYFNKVELIAYSLLPNHFHLVLHQVEQGAVESFLRSLSTRYSMYFNKKYQRQGSLFEGAYKSAHIAEEKTLISLVAYLEQTHKGNKYSSNAKNTTTELGSTISSGCIEKIFTDAGIVLSQGENDFTTYAEKHIFSNEETEELNKLILEKNENLLERRNLAASNSTQQMTPLKGTATPRKTTPSRIPEYIVLSLGFVFLLGVGIWNVNVSSIQAMTKDDVTTGSVENKTLHLSGLAEKDTQREGSDEEVLSATVSATEAITESTDPSDLLFTPIQILEGSRVVNIYNQPSLSADIHRTAKEGEYFDGAPVDLDWYEVRLNGQTTGFIQSEYIKLRQDTNL